ncbi:MAG TPA: toll/interleukin-1 receptor domain-containing protein, partial [Chloroflexota bacterium]|nr:toll/interleukin-1 receptor domain-containing protein [Chloroflexota bacterium]
MRAGWRRPAAWHQAVPRAAALRGNGLTRWGVHVDPTGCSRYKGAESPADRTAPSPTSGQVFISYSSDDLALAFALEAKLKAEAIPVWLDKHSIPAGSSWDAAIVEGIKQSAVVAVCVSPKAVASDNVRQELRLAMQYKKPILPLLLTPTTYPGEVEYVLAGRQWVEVL